MRKIQTQGVHHITLVGAKRQTSIDFWEGVLGMPFVFEQPRARRKLGAIGDQAMTPVLGLLDEPLLLDRSIAVDVFAHKLPD